MAIVEATAIDMDFRTKIRAEPLAWKIGHPQRGLSLGSCFAGNIARRMQRAKFTVTDNPFGVLFNPFSIADAIEALASCRKFTQADLSEHNGVWSSFSFHGSFSAVDPDAALVAMNRSAEQGAQALRQADYVIITFGSAWIYELAAQPGAVAANCHRFPSSAFLRRQLTVEEIVSRYDALLAGPLEGKHAIFTVSPVRHLRDGFAGNSVSKATLLLAVSELTRRHTRANYFPAFEIMNDDLRDYRFYGEDMVHPSDMAVDYIWSVFCELALDEGAAGAVPAFEKLAAAMEHRPVNPGSAEHRSFLKSMYDKAASLQRQYPEADLSAELGYFGTQE